MAAAAKFNALAKLHHAHAVAVFLAEEGDGTELLGLFDRHIAMVLHRNVLADTAVHDAFHLAQFLGRNLLEMRKVEAQVVGRHERALLLHVRAEHLAQGLVEQVRGSVVGFAGMACLSVHRGMESGGGISRQLLGEMYGQIVLALHVEDFHRFCLALQRASVAHLSAHFGVERRGV